MPPMRVLEVRIADESAGWRAAGFNVRNDGQFNIGDVDFQLLGKNAARPGQYPVLSWLLLDPSARARPGSFETRAVEGLDIRLTSEDPGEAIKRAHPNRAEQVASLVIQTPDVERTVKALKDTLGMEPRRVIIPKDGKAPTMALFKIGSTIIEVVRGSGQTRFWGLMVETQDIEKTYELVKERGGARKLKDAVQPGRKIFTLENKAVGVGVDVAFISRNPKARPQKQNWSKV
ncbi:hypothetical protein M427DRAFT_133529 [Gonapodya prolifera JEL478]|uniref:VOC domain-containing protein n=1 Tax=Gonapodya prolifera (strain JEL478) TaxID=1344416 RepID=A0A139AKW6_GONPJ|nr:hypothetical protein M427DRAFT_133529 [Gonapodya prolifera JEL478]|eukprot:KXS17416.1 hypothetical protein M427DRAFT_133529 [Gonapodya prolifera JEL478]